MLGTRPNLNKTPRPIENPYREEITEILELVEVKNVIIGKLEKEKKELEEKFGIDTSDSLVSQNNLGFGENKNFLRIKELTIL